MVFLLNERHAYGAPVIYVGEEQAQVGMLPGLYIDLHAVFASE